MKNGLKVNYDPKDKTLIDAVCEGYEKYCKIYRIFPKQIYIPHEEAGYSTPLLEVHLDSTLQPGTIWLG